MEKEVSADGEKDWKDTITAAPGDTLHFRIHYKNTGTVNQMKINAKDTLPETMTYITTTNTEDPSRNVELKWTSGVIGQEPVYDKVSLMVKPGDFFGGSGVVVGDYRPNEEFYYYYDVKLASAESFEQCSTDIWNKAQIATFDGTEHDSVKVTVVKDCSTPEDVPEELPDTGLGKVAGIVSIVLGGSACVYLVCMSKAFRKN
jgi:uncharacterized repeat protein (TIGR01451 family)